MSTLEIDLTEVLFRKSHNAFKHLLNGITLVDFQTIDVLLTLAIKKNIITAETGLGKTIIACAVIKALHNKDPKTKFMFVSYKSLLTQVTEDLREYTGLRVGELTGEYSSFSNFMSKDLWNTSDILVVTPQALNNPTTVSELYKVARNNITGIVLDEIHLLQNYLESSYSWMIKGITYSCEYVVGLSATLMTTSLQQIANIAHIVNPELFFNPRKLLREMESGESPVRNYPGVFISRTRRDLGIISNYKTDSIFTEPHEIHLGEIVGPVTQTTKGPGSVRQRDALINKIIEHKSKGRKGLVFIHHTLVREWVEEGLREKGISFLSLHGKITSRVERDRIQEEFNQSDTGLLLTSVTRGLNLDSDYLILYEFNAELKQILGRIERGLNPKTLYITFIFTKVPKELVYFKEQIYKKSLIIQSILEQDYRVILETGRKVLFEERDIGGS